MTIPERQPTIDIKPHIEKREKTLKIQERLRIFGQEIAKILEEYKSKVAEFSQREANIKGESFDHAKFAQYQQNNYFSNWWSPNSFTQNEISQFNSLKQLYKELKKLITLIQTDISSGKLCELKSKVNDLLTEADGLDDDLKTKIQTLLEICGFEISANNFNKIMMLSVDLDAQITRLEEAIKPDKNMQEIKKVGMNQAELNRIHALLFRFFKKTSAVETAFTMIQETAKSLLENNANKCFSFLEGFSEDALRMIKESIKKEEDKDDGFLKEIEIQCNEAKK